MSAMAAQAKLIALNTTNALKQSVVMKSHKISRTTNFPPSLITELRPKLRNTFTTTKAKTRRQSIQYEDDMRRKHTAQNALIIESEDQDTINQVNELSRHIHHHSTVFHLSASRSISPTARPSVHIFRRPEYRDNIKKIAKDYDCKIWCFDAMNKFGIFGENEYNRMCCIQHIRNYINSVAETDLDYIRCNEIYKKIYFSKWNDAFLNLIEFCNDKYDKPYSIITTNCDMGHVWIWSKNEECRKYICKYIENDLKHNWCYKYFDIEDAKISILFGRPHNEKHGAHEKGERYNEFWKVFKWDTEQKCCYFVNKYDQKCRFKYKYIADPKHICHKICIVVSAQHYENMLDAKNALIDIDWLLNKCINNDLNVIGFCVEYQCVLTGYFANNIDYRILYDGNQERDVLYVKHDDVEEYDRFKSLLYDDIVANTIIYEFESRREANIFQRLIMGKINLNFVQVLSKSNGENKLIIYDQKIGANKKFKENIINMIEDIRNNEFDSMYIGYEYNAMIVGPNGTNYKDMLNYCGLDTAFYMPLCQNNEDGTLLFGISKTDKRLLKLKDLIQSVVDNCEEIKLSAKEWTYLSQNKAWNIILFQNVFPKCCISLSRLTADKMLFYGSEKVKNDLLNKIKVPRKCTAVANNNSDELYNF